MGFTSFGTVWKPVVRMHLTREDHQPHCVGYTLKKRLDGLRGDVDFDLDDDPVLPPPGPHDLYCFNDGGRPGLNSSFFNCFKTAANKEKKFNIMFSEESVAEHRKVRCFQLSMSKQN